MVAADTYLCSELPCTLRGFNLRNKIPLALRLEVGENAIEVHLPTAITRAIYAASLDSGNFASSPTIIFESIEAIRA